MTDLSNEIFRVNVVEDASTVEMCGALKNIVACAAGFVQGLKLGDNTKSAVIRIGLMEMMKYAKEFGDNAKLETFLESCGVADLVTTCYGGRNARIGREFVLQRKSVEQLETELLNGTWKKFEKKKITKKFFIEIQSLQFDDFLFDLLGQKSQGPETAAEVNFMLKGKNMENQFPLFTAVHRIFINQMQPEEFIDTLRNHPVHADRNYSQL